MSETSTFKPKKSVALSGTPAGSARRCARWGTAATICTIADTTSRTWRRTASLKKWRICWCMASCRMRRNWPHYKASLRPLRSLPAAVKQALELLPPATHPMDVLRTGVSVLGCVLPEGASHKDAGARKIADTLLASLGSMLLYWHHYARNGRRIEVERFEDSIACAFFAFACMGRRRAQSGRRRCRRR